MKKSVLFRIFIFLSLVFVAPILSSCMKKGDIAVQQGASYFQRGRFDLAETAYKMALDVECSYPKEDIYVLISNCYSQRGDYDTAIEWRNKALAITEDAENYMNLGMIYRLKNDELKAEEMFKKAVEIAPMGANTYGSLGSLYLSQDRVDEAIPLLEKCLELNPRIAQIHADLAVCYARKGLFDEAEESFEEAQRYRLDTISQFRAEIDELEKKAGYSREK